MKRKKLWEQLHNFNSNLNDKLYIRKKQTKKYFINVSEVKVVFQHQTFQNHNLTDLLTFHIFFSFFMIIGLL